MSEGANLKSCWWQPRTFVLPIVWSQTCLLNPEFVSAVCGNTEFEGGLKETFWGPAEEGPLLGMSFGFGAVAWHQEFVENTFWFDKIEFGGVRFDEGVVVDVRDDASNSQNWNSEWVIQVRHVIKDREKGWFETGNKIFFERNWRILVQWIAYPKATICLNISFTSNIISDTSNVLETAFPFIWTSAGRPRNSQM